jgi:hypothetical protein
MAVVGTMSALVISLLISSGSASLKSRTGDVALLANDIMRLDTLLRRYGPESGPVRDALQRYAAMKVEDLFPSNTRPNVDNPATLKMLDHVEDLILTPQTQRRPAALAEHPGAPTHGGGWRRAGAVVPRERKLPGGWL